MWVSMIVLCCRSSSSGSWQLLPPSFCLLAPVGWLSVCPCVSAWRNTSLAATRAELSWLSRRYVSFEKLATTLTTVSVHTHTHTALGFNREDEAPVTPDPRRSRMPVKGGGRLHSYPSRSENVGVSGTVWHVWRYAGERSLAQLRP